MTDIKLVCLIESVIVTFFGIPGIVANGAEMCFGRFTRYIVQQSRKNRMYKIVILGISHFGVIRFFDTD